MLYAIPPDSYTKIRAISQIITSQGLVLHQAYSTKFFVTQFDGHGTMHLASLALASSLCLLIEVQQDQELLCELRERERLNLKSGGHNERAWD